MAPGARAAWEAADSTWSAVSGRIITARFRAQHIFTTIIGVYAPTELATPDDKTKFYSLLQRTVDSTPKRTS